MNCSTFNSWLRSAAIVGATLCGPVVCESMGRADVQDPPPALEQPAAGDAVDSSDDAPRPDASGRELQPPDHPLRAIARHMRLVKERLSQGVVERTTQSMQDAIVEELDRLIDEAQQQQQQQQEGGQSSQSRADSEGQAGSQAGQRPSTIEGDGVPSPGEGGEDASGWWGKLPPQLREQLRQASNDEFLPRYEKLIEAYYRRLAESW